MCGIAGIVSCNKKIITTTALESMAKALSHRGPDGSGIWINENTTTGLAHRRLSIIDLSEQAHQPMKYLNRYCIVHNGEIYNYIELRDYLNKKGYQFYSKSDTEVIAAAYDCFKETCIEQFDGMFAFAIWDEQEQTLFCARDRFGEKPFYFFYDDESFVFASEIKALWSIGIEKKIDYSMLINYIAIGQTIHPLDQKKTFYQNIYSLNHASYLTYHLLTQKIQTQRYWDLDKQANQTISEKSAVEKLEDLFIQSIKKRMRSDVSIGSSLSGGLDSSSIVYYLMQEMAEPKALKTFSAIFPSFEKDESVNINLMQQHLSFNNIKVMSDENYMHRHFEKIIYHQEQPFTSASVVAQYAVFELAAQNNCKVLLDGQGSDEILSGYSKYIHWYLQQLFRSRMFKQYKHEKNAFVKNNVSFEWNYKNFLAAQMPAWTAFYLQNNTIRNITQNKNFNPDFIKTYFDKNSIYKPIISKLNDVLYADTMQNNLQQLLHYADRNSMAHGVEVRLPFLNHQLVEFIFSLPASMKMKDGFGKWALRKMMDKKIPHEIVWQKNKTAFEPPQKKWMSHPTTMQLLKQSKEILYSKNIISKKCFDAPIQAHTAYEKESLDWRLLIAGAML